MLDPFSLDVGILLGMLLGALLAPRIRLAIWRRRLRLTSAERLNFARETMERFHEFAAEDARQEKIAAALARQKTAPHDPWLDEPFTPEEEAILAAAEHEEGEPWE